MARRRRRYLARYAAQALLYELTQRPARAIAREHGKVVDMHVGIAVRGGYLVVVDLAQPVVGGDRARVGQDKSADRVRDRRVLFDAPIRRFDIAVYKILIVEDGRLHVAYLLALLAVKYVRFGDVGIAGLYQNALDAVLNVLDRDKPVVDLARKISGNAQRYKIDYIIVVLLGLRVERLFDRLTYLGYVKRSCLSVSFDYLKHVNLRKCCHYSTRQ